jgi:hypothetical protein
MAPCPAEGPPAPYRATGRATSARGPAMGRPSGRGWSGPHAWSSWHGWRGRRRRGPDRASPRHSDTGPRCCANHGPLIEGKRWLRTSAWPTGSPSRSSWPIPPARGHAAPTRTRRGCCASTGPRVPTCRATRRASCTPSPIASTRVPKNVSTVPRPGKSLRTCALIHPLHLELETAQAKTTTSP